MVPNFIKYEGRSSRLFTPNEEARRMILKFNTLATQAWLCLHGGPKRYRPQLLGDYSSLWERSTLNPTIRRSSYNPNY
jgi:hypothetical protein